MVRLAEFLISTLDLVDAQAREIGRTGQRAARAAALSVGFSVVLIAGLGLLLAALVVALGPRIGYAWALCVTGLVAVAVGLIGIRIR